MSYVRVSVGFGGKTCLDIAVFVLPFGDLLIYKIMNKITFLRHVTTPLS